MCSGATRDAAGHLHSFGIGRSEPSDESFGGVPPLGNCRKHSTPISGDPRSGSKAQRGLGKRSPSDPPWGPSLVRSAPAGSEIAREDVARIVTLRLGVIPVGPSARLVEHRKQREEEG